MVRFQMTIQVIICLKMLSKGKPFLDKREGDYFTASEGAQIKSCAAFGKKMEEGREKVDQPNFPPALLFPMECANIFATA